MIILHLECEIMKEYNKEILKDAANRLLFDMTDEQYDTLLNTSNIL